MAKLSISRGKDRIWRVKDENGKEVAQAPSRNWHKEFRDDIEKYYGINYKMTDFLIELIYHQSFGDYRTFEKGNYDNKLNDAEYQKHRTQALNAFFKPLNEATEQRHKEAVKTAYKKHYDRAGAKNKAKFTREIEKYDNYKTLTELMGEFKALRRVLRTYGVYLQELIEYGKKELEGNKKLKYKGKDIYTFSVSTRYFADYLAKKGYKTNRVVIGKLFNLFTLLGFTNKEFGEAEKHFTKKEDHAYNITFFSVNEMNLQNANKVAEQLIDNGYKFNSFSGKFVLQVFGGQIHDKVFAKPEPRKVKEADKPDGIVEVISLKEYKKRDDEDKKKLINSLTGYDLRDIFADEDLPF